MTRTIYETSSDVYLLGTRKRRHRVFKEINDGDYIRTPHICATLSFGAVYLFSFKQISVLQTRARARAHARLLFKWRMCFLSVEIIARYILSSPPPLPPFGRQSRVSSPRDKIKRESHFTSNR